MSRVLVVGGGMAGAMAALAAAREGAEVTQAWRAPGATALSMGALRIAGDLGGLAPEHPLARLGDPLTLGTVMDEACDALQAGLRAAGHELQGAWRRTGAYADIHGRPREGALVPAAVAAGELGALRGRRVAVAGIAAVSEYDAESTAEAMRELAGVDAFAASVDLGEIPPGGSLTDVAGRQAPDVTHIRAEAIAFPPGLAGLPKRGFELLAGAPSPHGWALHRALERMLAGAGVRRVRADVSRFEAQGGRLLAAIAGGEAMAADAFVLATGRYIGGGLERGRSTAEPLLGLEIFFEGAPAGASRRLTHLLDLEPDAAFLEGVRTDGGLRPVDAAGRPTHDNLRAAGAVLAGWDLAGPEGMGVPLLTGWLAGRWSAR